MNFVMLGSAYIQGQSNHSMHNACRQFLNCTDFKCKLFKPSTDYTGHRFSHSMVNFPFLLSYLSNVGNKRLLWFLTIRIRNFKLISKVTKCSTEQAKYISTDKLQHVFILCTMTSSCKTVLQIERGKRDNLGIIFHITPLKLML